MAVVVPMVGVGEERISCLHEVSCCCGERHGAIRTAGEYEQ